MVFSIAAPDALPDFGFVDSLIALFTRISAEIYTKAADHDGEQILEHY